MLAVLLLAGGCASFLPFGPFYEKSTDLPGGATEERWMFGLAERRTWPDGSVERVLRPLAASITAPAFDTSSAATRWSVIPPIASGAWNDDRRRTSIWPFFSDTSYGTDAERAKELSDDDTWIAPLFAWGHEPDEGDYFAFFPFYGTLKGKLLADEVNFWAFPAYVTTKAGTWHSTHVLWPLIAWGEDPANDRSHARFLPFWSQTDGPHRHSRTLLWPIIHWGENVNEQRVTNGWFVFPLGGHRTSTDGEYEETSVLFPFFEWSDDQRSGDRTRAMPWPFYRTVVRPGESSSTWYWPIHGDFRSKTEESDFWAWPIVWIGKYDDGARTSSRTFVVPIWMQREAGPKGAPRDHREIRAWPFFSWEEVPGGLETVRVPEIVPFFGWRAGESTYADLFALYRRRSDREGRVAVDLPLGIVQWRRQLDGSSKLKLFWWLELSLGGTR